MIPRDNSLESGKPVSITDELPSHYYSPKTGLFAFIIYFFPILLIRFVFFPSEIFLLIEFAIRLLIMAVILSAFSSLGISNLSIVSGMFGSLFLAAFVLVVQFESDFIIYFINIGIGAIIGYYGNQLCENEVMSYMMRDLQELMLRKNLVRVKLHSWKKWVSASNYFEPVGDDDNSYIKPSLELCESHKASFSRELMTKIQNKGLLDFGFEFDRESIELIYQPDMSLKTDLKYPRLKKYLSPIGGICAFALYFGSMCVVYFVLISGTPEKLFSTFTQVLVPILLMSSIFAFFGFLGKKEFPMLAIFPAIFMMPFFIMFTSIFGDEMLDIIFYCSNIFIAYGISWVFSKTVSSEVVRNMMRDVQDFMIERNLSEFVLKSWPKWISIRSIANKAKIVKSRKFGISNFILDKEKMVLKR